MGWHGVRSTWAGTWHGVTWGDMGCGAHGQGP